MKAILTSSIGGSIKENGMRIPTALMNLNGQLDKIKEFWTANAKIMLISASPDDYDRNDMMFNCFKESFPMSGLSVSLFTMCDSRTEEVIEQLSQMDVILLSGGHVPTQNAFFKRIGLKDKLQGFGGLIIAWSAGSMNCAETVYAGPECEGEAIDPDYRRWISGLGVTKVNILPHFQSIKDDILDGMRLIEDITYADSMGHEILALNDGSYIVVDGDKETLYGEAYSIKDGCQTRICQNGESVSLSNKNMKKYKRSATLFYIASVLFYIAAIIHYVGDGTGSMGAMWLCLGSTYLCLGSVYTKKSKENDEDKEE